MFDLFDNLIVLSRHGSIIYQGSPSDLRLTLQLVGLTIPMYSNTLDFMLEVANGDYGEDSVRTLTGYNVDYNANRFAGEQDHNEVELCSLSEAIDAANTTKKR